MGDEEAYSWKVLSAAAELRSARADGGVRPSNLNLFVLVGFVHHEPAEFVGDVQQALIFFVPLRADFT
jgi:hypothetical protein